MRIACSQCRTTYEFDVSAIPSAGYDAQCTTCGAVFFLDPGAQAELVSVGCEDCSAIYQFDAAAIPQEGYDAQCTECGAVFFVAPQKTPPGAVKGGNGDGNGQPVLLEQGSATPGGQRQEQGAAEEQLASPASTGSQVRTPRRRWRSVLVTLVGLSLLSGAGAFLYQQRREAIDSWLARAVRRYAGLTPKIKASLDRAHTRMLDDTDAAFTEALAELRQARAADPNAPETLALVSLNHILHGVAQGERAQRARAKAEEAIRRLAALEELPKHRRTRLVATQAEALRELVHGADQEAEKLLAASRDTLTRGLKALEKGRGETAELALAAEAAGLYYARDAAAVSKAEQMLGKSLSLRAGAGATLDLTRPPSCWGPYLRGRIITAKGGDPEEAVAAFRAALGKEPRFQRARYRLAQVLLASGWREKALGLVGEILVHAPTHTGALAILEATSPQRPESNPDAAPLRRAKRRRGKRRL